MTKLEAVNACLLSLHLAPINTLDGPLSTEAIIASSVIDAVSAEVQRRGWLFNTVEDRTLAPSDDNTISLSQSVLSVEFDRYKNPNPNAYTMRGVRVFDRINDTFTITTPVYARRIVYLLEWSDLPTAAQSYIAKRAAREVTSKIPGTQQTVQIAGLEETQAWVALLNDTGCCKKVNYLEAPQVSEAAWRHL